MKISPWFGGGKVDVIPLVGTELVAFSWSIPAAADPETHVETINDLIVWHHCEHPLWRGDPSRNQSLVDIYDGWHATGVGAHTLVQVDPVTITASVYWPDCCGLHGFITNGAWIPA